MAIMSSVLFFVASLYGTHCGTRVCGSSSPPASTTTAHSTVPARPRTEALAKMTHVPKTAPRPAHVLISLKRGE